MEAKPGRLVKAVYDFPTDDASELPLLVGDVVQVQERIDKQWSRGVSANREGNFPIGFTVDLKPPPLADHQQLFAVTNDFIAQEKGDLTLSKGDLVIGHNPIDSNWWCGETEDGSRGIFPVTHVWKVDKSILPVINTNKMFARARVKMNMTAQLPEEMDLSKDEIVNIIEEVEKGWYRGECNGRQGIFPASFVTLLPDSATENSLPVPCTVTTAATETYDNKYGYDCINSGISPYGRALYPFQAEYANELCLKGDEIVNLIRHVDNNWIEGEVDGKTGIFPASFINIIVDCQEADSKLAESINGTNESEMFPPDSYGRVIGDFIPQFEGDVTLREGDTVTLIRKVDKNWYEVETDNGESGICPESYIEVIGSGPPSYSEVMATIGSHKHNSSLLDIDCNFSDDAKNSSKSGRPLSFASSASDSSFSSQNSSNEKSCVKGTDKVAENLCGLDSTLFSNNASFNINRNSHVNYDNFGEHQSSRGVDTFLSSYDSSPRHFESEPSQKPADNRVQNSAIPKIVHTPARPPPPANITLTENISIFNNSSNSSVNTRQSISSSSSHSSSEGICDSMGENEIQIQIKNKEQILKQRLNCLNKIENEVKNTQNSSVLSELQTQISQLNEDIARLKKEIDSLNAKLKPNLSRTVSDQCGVDDRQKRDEEVERKKEIERKRREGERKNKMKEQRDCIITEILQTEKDYVSDLKLLHDTFLTHPEEAKSKGINVMALFGNLDEVINVADRLLKRLQKQATNSQLIGECFVDMGDEMKEVYGHYCRNHDEATSVLDKIDFQSPAGHFINHKLEILKRQTNVFDLGAMLIKPVQRILKYPLLLDQLFKCTEDEHADKEGLKQAIGMMSDVATAINEFRRQKDLVFKYRKQSDTSLSGRISKFSLHSVAKKSSRLGMRLSSSIGLTNVTVDQDFQKVVTKFNALKKTLKIFLEDLSDYSKKSEELYTCAFNIAEGIAEMYQERKSQQEVEQFRAAHKMILTQYWDSFKQTMERSIQSTIKQLLQAYRGPKNLIQKRYDKLLDFQSSTSKMDKNKDATKIKMLQDTQQMAKNNYEALNSQLLNDLPKLCDLSIDILCDCIHCFLKAKRNFIGRTARHMIGLMELPLMLGNQGSDILDTFHVKHTLVLDDLSRLSIAFKQFQSCIKTTDTLRKNPSPKGGRLSFGSVAPVIKLQTPNQKAKIKRSYPESELYTACENFDAVDIMDISLKKGDVVGVIKQQDPMGNRMRWFVDSGDSKGFVPAKCLMKFLPDSTSPLTSLWNTPTSNSSNIATTMLTPASSNASSIQKLYAKPQIVNPQPQAQMKQNGINQPTRPAPPLTTSLRMVAPSRYPPVPQPSTRLNQPSMTQPNTCQPTNPLSNPQRHTAPNVLPNTDVRNSNSSNISPNLNVNSNAVAIEPVHRYEEIPDTIHNIDGQNRSLRLLGDIPSVTASGTSRILDEFDPYSSAKLPEVYDNVPDNLNSLYNTHRYEDIPEDSYYDEVPNDAQLRESDEYYYAMYDFVPSGPNQLSLQKGQVVLVLHKCDLNQNSEWWFVEDRHGNKGYVPGQYLNKYSKEVL